jgi:hypothetical protein
MTVAVCLECGTLKTGAWSACPKCAFQPAGDEQLARSLIVSDNCIARETLEAMAERRRQGEPWNFDPELVEVVKGRLAVLIPKDHDGQPAGMTDSYRKSRAAGPVVSRRWWQFWK